MSVESLTITGIDGFVGRHVAKLAKSAGLTVRGVSRSLELPLELAEYVDEYYSADLTEEFPANALSDAIIHLAGLAAVGPSFSAPQLYVNANSSMITNMCETILDLGCQTDTRIVGISTGAVYAQSLSGEPIAETDPIVMSSPYVVSKVLVENLLSYYSSRGVKSVIARPFNHIGPGQGPGFIVPDLWEKLRNLRSAEPLRVGNLETQRDYLDVRDVAAAYLSLATSDAFGEETFNVCSGNSVSGLAVLAALCAELEIPIPELYIDETLLRPNDTAKIAGSAKKLRLKLGWEPVFTLSQSIADFVRSVQPATH